MSKQDWIQWVNTHGSGTCQRAIQTGMAWKNMALHERLAMEIGAAAELIPETRICLGKYEAESDCKVTTELNWYTRTLEMRHGDKVRVEPLYFYWAQDADTLKQGAGLRVYGLDQPWFPEGRILFLPVAYWNAKKKTWSSVENPL